MSYKSSGVEVYNKHGISIKMMTKKVAEITSMKIPDVKSLMTEITHQHLHPQSLHRQNHNRLSGKKLASHSDTKSEPEYKSTQEAKHKSPYSEHTASPKPFRPVKGSVKIG
ncbi:unnamed protein product [Owenia fusiformis]|uniref:Uncharacterized protein n=1 Tax=Owenia fusiformis TaxID=6347 RepID=A0A8J1XZH5_OWEFU|nr:unnamed protein product [Owenia fusiformis]